MFTFYSIPTLFCGNCIILKKPLQFCVYFNSIMMSDNMLPLLIHLVLLIYCRNLSYIKIGTQIVTQNTFPVCFVGPAWNQHACLRFLFPTETHLQASVSSSVNISYESHHDTFVDKTKEALCEYLADGAQKQCCGEGEGHELIQPLFRVWVQGVG